MSSRIFKLPTKPKFGRVVVSHLSRRLRPVAMAARSMYGVWVMRCACWCVARLPSGATESKFTVVRTNLLPLLARPGPAPKSSHAASASSPGVTSPTRGGGTVVVKVRAGGSGQSQLATKLREEKIANNGRMPTTATAAAAAATAARTPVPTAQTSKPAVPTQHKIVIAARQPPPSSPQQAAPTAAAAQPTVSVSSPSSSASPSASSSSSSRSLVGSSSKVASPPPGVFRSKATFYENPNAYTFASSGSGSTSTPTETPNGISLDLSGDRAGPQLVAVRSRSDRLRAACLAEDKHEVVNLLGQGTDPNQVDAYGNTALMLAASTGNADVVDELLTHGANVQSKDKYGQTALIFACSKGHYEVAKMLVDRKAGVNVTTSHGQTALMKVCYISHPHSGILAELLLTHKAKPDLQTPEEGTTAAMVAAQHDHMELLEILAHYGANLDLRRKSDGATVLHLSAEKASFTMVANLVGLGADHQVKDAQGRTCLEVTPRTDASSSSARMPLVDFQRKLQKALDRGQAQKETMAEQQREHAEIRRRLAEERQEKRRLELVAVKVAEGLTNVQAQRAVDQAIGDLSGDGGEGGQGSGHATKIAYIDDEGVEHYSRPPSAKMTADELKARTYKPQIDPRSVFGDPEPEPADEAKATTQVHFQSSSSSSLSFSAYGASSSSAPPPPRSYNDAMQQEDDDEEEEEMVMVQHQY